MLLSSRPARAAARLLLLATPGLAACTSVEVASTNLDALHGPGGRYRYRAELTSPWRRFMARLSGQVFSGDEAWISGSISRAVKDPARRTFRELRSLASFERDRPSLQASQVRAYAWLASVDPSALVRERAFLELGPHARRLALDVPPQTLDPALAVQPAEFFEAVRGLYDVVPPILERGAQATPGERADFEAAITLLGERRYDMEGGRRLLKALAILLAGERAGRPELAALLELSLEVQRELTSQALAAGLVDPVPNVRAAAFEAAYAAYGDRFLAEAILALDGASRVPEEEGLGRFGLAEESPSAEEVFVRVFGLVGEHGLPAGDPYGEGLDAGRSGLRRMAYQFAILRVALNYTRFGDRSRTAAVLALYEVAPDGPATLRAEEWQDWWTSWAGSAEERLRQLSATDPTGPPPAPERERGARPHADEER